MLIRGSSRCNDYGHMKHSDPSSNLGQDCISHDIINILGKDKNQTILIPATSKY